MIRTQVYLTDEEKEGLRELAEETGRSQSELIRRAIDGYLDAHSAARRQERIKRAFGMWEDRDDVPDAAELRGEWDRFG